MGTRTCPAGFRLIRSSFIATGVTLLAATAAAQPTTIIKASALSSELPCPGVGSFAVDANYTPTENGSHCLVPNHHAPSNRYNVSDQGRNTPIADPTMMVFDNRYYLTGTADEYGTANFPLFVATDLTDWRIMRTAFDDQMRRTDSRGEQIIRINNRDFKDMWAPHLFYDPLANRIYLSFTATECVSGVCDLEFNARTLRQSIYSVSVSVNGYRLGRYFADPNDGNQHEPLAYGYRQNNLSTQRFLDGGWNQARGLKLIPTSGNATLIYPGPYCPPGTGCLRSGRPGFSTAPGFLDIVANPPRSSITLEKRTWLHLDSFVFFDPHYGNQRWMLYTFEGSPIDSLKGHNIAAYPMVDSETMDANSSELLPFAAAKNSHNRRNAAANGCSGSSNPGVWCIAEGPAVFERNGWYYFIVSRNDTGTSDYMLTYRRARSFRELAARNWDDQDIPEETLAVSSQRGIPGGISFGHGEVFRSLSENRYYLILHRKEAHPEWWLHRHPFVKELTFNDSTGAIESLQDNDPRGLKNDLNYFLIPRPLT